MKAKDYLEKKAEAEKAAAEAGEPPTFKAPASPSFICKVGQAGGVILNGTCPAEDALVLATWIHDTYSE